MGDRGNIVIRQRKNTNADDIWFYSHNGGEGLPLVLQQAIQRQVRWNDETYLARIIFCAMICESDDLKGEIGYGISCRITDNEHSILVVDVPSQCVHIISEDICTNGRVPANLNARLVIATYTFKEYIELTELPAI